MSRAVAYGLGLALVVAVALPGFRDPTDDSYPLSTYPMFARPRGKPTLYFMEGIDAAGRRVRVAPDLIAGQEVMQAAATVRRAAQRGEGAMARLCERVAERTAARAEPTGIRELLIVRATFDPLRYFAEGSEPESRDEQFRCAVPVRS